MSNKQNVVAVMCTASQTKQWRAVRAAPCFCSWIAPLREDSCRAVRALRRCTPQRSTRPEMEVSSCWQPRDGPTGKWILRPQMRFWMMAARLTSWLWPPERPWDRTSHLRGSWIPASQKIYQIISIVLVHYILGVICYITMDNLRQCLILSRQRVHLTYLFFLGANIH